MVEAIVEFLTSLTELWPFVLPFLPYLGTMLVVGQVMKRFVKPIVAAHRRGKRGKFHNKYWAIAHRMMVFYPMLLGAACGGLCIATGVGGHILAYVASGAAAQLVYREYLHWREERGVV